MFHRRIASGFSTTELVVAIAIMLLLAAAITTVQLGSQRAAADRAAQMSVEMALAELEEVRLLAGGAYPENLASQANAAGLTFTADASTDPSEVSVHWVGPDTAVVSVFSDSELCWVAVDQVSQTRFGVFSGECRASTVPTELISASSFSEVTP